MNFTEPFYARPFVLVTPKRSDNNNNANRSGSRCNAVTAWVEVRNTSYDLCVRYGKRPGNGTDIPNQLETMNINMTLLTEQRQYRSLNGNVTIAYK